jgi:hypothetical protein
MLLNIASGWDVVRIIGFTKILADKKLELLFLLTLVDLGKGMALFYYANSLGETNWPLILFGLLTFLCSSIKYFYFQNTAYFLPVLGYVWPVFPEIVNTGIVLCIIFLYIFFASKI